MAIVSETVDRRAGMGEPRPSVGRLLIYAFLVVGGIVSVVPFIFMLMTALKTFGSMVAGNVWPWPPFGTEAPQFENFALAVRTIGWDNQWGTWLFVRYFANSAIMAVAVTLGVLVTSVMAAYALTHVNLPGRNAIFIIILATIMIPPDLTLVPKVVMMYQLGWYNTYWALTVPFMASVFGIFLLRQFFLQIPRDLFEAARIDGAGHPRYLIAVVVPLSKSAIVTIALLQFIWEWDSFKWPLLVTRDTNMRVLAVGLQQFMIGEGGTNTHLLMAFSTIVILPVIVFYFLTQKHFREGIVTTGIKG